MMSLRSLDSPSMNSRSTRRASLAAFWLFATFPLALPVQQALPSGTLTVVITGLASDMGSVRIALSDSEDNYYDYPNPTIGISAPIQRGVAVWHFEKLARGSYALKAFHDEDGDGDLDTNFLGIPVEDYGFSNNASGLFGPPSWDAACFRFDADTLTVWISLD